MLAGDGIRIDVPVALMERAATTGWHAANCLLARWGLAGHDLYTVPTRGRFALLRALAERQPAAGRDASDEGEPAMTDRFARTGSSGALAAEPRRCGRCPRRPGRGSRRPTPTPGPR